MTVFSIIVTYNPNISQLKACIASLLPQSEKIIIVKNSDERLDDADFQNEKIMQVQLDRNYGIAYAQNRGIEFAFAHGADFLLFSDQDTLYPPDFLKKALACFARHINENVAVVVPVFYNENKKQLAKVSIAKTKAVCPAISGDMYLAQAISSGSLCSVKVFKTVGMMNERLFIDWVDTEWCWRATKVGCKIICATDNVIHHSMGDSFKKVFGRKIVMYSDFRNYFFLRNGTYLLFHSRLLSPREWISLAKFMFLKSLLFFLTGRFSISRIRLFVRTIVKGLTNNFSLEEEIK